MQSIGYVRVCMCGPAPPWQLLMALAASAQCCLQSGSECLPRARAIVPHCGARVAQALAHNACERRLTVLAPALVSVDHISAGRLPQVRARLGHAILAAAAPHNPGVQTVTSPGSLGVRSIHPHKCQTGIAAALKLIRTNTNE